jgi:hypothetical protein
MIDPIVQQISQKFGLPADQARNIVLAVVDQLKTRLPAPLNSQLDAVISGKSGLTSGDVAKNVMEGAQGLFGKKNA